VKCLRLIADKAYPELATLVIPSGLMGLCAAACGLAHDAYIGASGSFHAERHRTRLDVSCIRLQVIFPITHELINLSRRNFGFYFVIVKNIDYFGKFLIEFNHINFKTKAFIESSLTIEQCFQLRHYFF
jgi:hypothetical protein